MSLKLLAIKELAKNERFTVIRNFYTVFSSFRLKIKLAKVKE